MLIIMFRNVSGVKESASLVPSHQKWIPHLPRVDKRPGKSSVNILGDMRN
jgi:hypothetical protein